MNLINISLTITILMAIWSFAISIYGLILNYRQAKVNDKMDVLIEEVRKLQRR